jgi:antitoxin YefM
MYPVVEFKWSSIVDIISYTHVRNNFAGVMEQVCNNHVPVIITRKNSASVVMISLDDYNAIMETGYLLRSPKNAEKLAKSVQELENNKLVKKLDGDLDL